MGHVLPQRAGVAQLPCPLRLAFGGRAQGGPSTLHSILTMLQFDVSCPAGTQCAVQRYLVLDHAELTPAMGMQTQARGRGVRGSTEGVPRGNIDATWAHDQFADQGPERPRCALPDGIFSGSWPECLARCMHQGEDSLLGCSAVAANLRIHVDWVNVLLDGMPGVRPAPQNCEAHDDSGVALAGKSQAQVGARSRVQ